MQMHLSSDVQITDGLLATNALLAENSRQGFETYSGTLHQGFEVAISSTSLGISNPLYDGRVRSRCTGKERDAESGLDYFGARYYGSSMGRFMSPDSGADATVGVPVPFADLGNPQSLNLYSYVLNNPVRNVDGDGHNVTVCASGSSQCYDLTDDQWKSIQKQIAAGNSGGVTVSGQGFMGTGTINCGGSACGTATYHEQGLIDESGSQLAGIALGMGIGKAVGAAWGAVAGWLGRGTGEAAGAVAETAASTGKVLLQAGTKQEAKAVVEAMADGAQKQAAKRALARAGSNASVSISESESGLVRVEVTRPGFDGTQTMTKAIDSSGNTTTVQSAHDASGALVHYDPK
jgi:RHS repeat-associated protein